MVTAAVAIVLFAQVEVVTCPIMSVEPVASVGEYDYKGVRLGFCCAGCRNAFESDPGEVLEAAKKAGRVFAVSVFDPVSRQSLPIPTEGLAFRDFEGVRYRFVSDANRQKFIAAPAAFAKSPAKESTHCFAKRKEMGSYAAAHSFGDFHEVRYYLDCHECIRRFTEDPDSFARAAAPSVRPAQPHLVPKARSKPPSSSAAKG